MPTVPVLNDNQVRLNPLSGERFEAPDIGAGGRMIGKALQGFGQTANEVFTDIDVQQSEARAKKADAEYQDYERERLLGEDGFFTKKSGDAIDAQRTVQEDLQKKRAELLARAQGRERGMLEEVLERRGQSAADGIMRHVVGETRQFNVDSITSRISSSTENYVAYAGVDDERAGEELATIKNEFTRLADLEGWNNPSILEAKRIEVLGGVHATMIETLMQRDPRKAQAYLDENRAEIDAKTEITLGNRLEPLVVDADAREIADIAEGEFTTSVAEAPDPTSASGEPKAVRVANYSARPTPGVARSRKAFPNSYRSPAYDALDQQYEAKYGLPAGLLSSIRLDGERSNANQVSSAGARGPYQFIGSTRQGFISRYGIDPWRSPEEQAEAAAIHLRDDYRKYGSWERAIAAYNGGHRGATKPVKETRDYIARVQNGLAARGTSVASAGGVREIEKADLGVRAEQAEAEVRARFAHLGPRQVELRVEAAKAELKRRDAERVSERRANEQAEWEMTLEAADAMGGWSNVMSPTQIPNFNELPASRRLQIRNLVQANTRAAAAGREEARETNYVAYDRYLNMKPEELRQVPLDELHGNLSKGKLDEVLKRRAAKADNGKGWTSRSILTVTSGLLGEAGLAAGDSKDARKAAPKVNEFLRDMMGWAERVQKETGKWPPEEMVRKNADRLLIEGYFINADGDRVKGRAFEAPNNRIQSEIPAATRNTIASALRKALKREPTGKEINRAYIDGKGIDW